MSDGSLFFTPSLRLSRFWHGGVSSGIFPFCSHPFCRDTLMHRKWHGLFQVLAGAGTAALVWSLLRHKSRKARRRVVRRRSETDHAAICEAQGEKQGRSGAQVGVRETGSVQTSQGQEQQQEQQSGSSTPERTPSEDRDVLDEDPEDGPLYQVTENALIVHQMLLQGESRCRHHMQQCACLCPSAGLQQCAPRHTAALGSPARPSKHCDRLRCAELAAVPQLLLRPPCQLGPRHVAWHALQRGLPWCTCAGDEEIQFRDFSALPVNGEPGGQHPAVDLANKVGRRLEFLFVQLSELLRAPAHCCVGHGEI